MYGDSAYTEKLFLGTNHIFIGVVHPAVCSNSLGFFSNVAAIVSDVTGILCCGQMAVVSLINCQFFIVSPLELAVALRPSVLASLSFWSSSGLHEVHYSSSSSPLFGE